jgi:hypothetical protein
MAFRLLKKRMHMVRHHYPCDQVVSLGVEVEQRFLNHFADARLAEHAATMTIVNPGLQASAAFRVLCFFWKGIQILLKTSYRVER